MVPAGKDAADIVDIVDIVDIDHADYLVALHIDVDPVGVAVVELTIVARHAESVLALVVKAQIQVAQKDEMMEAVVVVIAESQVATQVRGDGGALEEVVLALEAEKERMAEVAVAVVEEAKKVGLEGVAV